MPAIPKNASKAPGSSPVLRIAVLAFDGISPFHLSVPLLVFGDDRSALGMPQFDVRVCAVKKGPLRVAGTAQLTLTARHGLGWLRQADVVIIPSWHRLGAVPPAPLLAALRQAHGRGARLVGLCLGAFLLGETGLLDGHRATTHWAWAQRFQTLYPAVLLDADVLYAESGSLLTSAGTAAALDCCLYLLRQLCGAEVAQRLARQLVVAPHRAGGQAQFIERPLPATGERDRLGQLLVWLEQHFAEPLTLDQLAARVAMSRRSFTRHFRQVTGTTAGAWLQQRRLDHARRLLETGRMTIDAIAVEAGFGSALVLRQHFQAHLQMAPTAYRAQFGV